MDKINVVLADQYDLVVNDTFQLYYRSVIEAPNPYIYSIVSSCEKGKHFPRYFEFKPTEEGSYKLTINVYDANRNVVGTAQTILNVVAPKTPTKKFNILCLGDSLTEGGVWVNELSRRISDTEGTPKGLGFSGVNFIGTCHKLNPSVGYEAYGGWQWVTFSSILDGAMWVECPNKKTAQDQHSLWKDENGAIWQLETLQFDYLKFNRYKYHNSPRPTSGVLTHYKNAVDQSPIVIKSSITETNSPFLNTNSMKIDVKNYLESNNFEKPDLVYILLGVNGLAREDANRLTREEYCKVVIKEAKELVDKIKSDVKDVKFKIMCPPLASINGGIGSNYGADPIFADGYGLTHYLFTLAKEYQAWANEDKYKDYVEYIDTKAQFDCEYNYPFKLKPVNSRSTEVERIDVNASHPTESGYLQIADSAFRNLVKALSKN